MNKFYITNTLNDTKEELITLNNTINWYSCGPTVYNDSHIGHARNYIVNDIIRRILLYYGYKVKLVMNITDIDDKIINKSKEIYNDGKEFLKISTKYEKSFFDDMDKLNIMRPDIITRATQYIEEIINYISNIQKNGFAYESNNSVYFDSQKYYESFKDNFNLNLNKESFDQDKISEKKNPQDFVLWKKSKDGEPFWESPWGEGRPGWHIECTSMASDIFGNTFDLHSGGCDLKFPHHENEIKQANAHNNKNKWVNFFIHVGHLNIEGLKMSKSLKNFITIKEILEKYNSNQLRLLFLMHKYNHTMDYSEDRLKQTNDILKNYTNFISNITILTENNNKYLQDDFDIIDEIDNIKEKIDFNFKDDFNTPEVINNLNDMIKKINKYILSKNGYKISIIKQSSDYLQKILNVMGINFNTSNNQNKITDKLLDIICNFRDDIKEYAFKNKQYELLKMTDKIRDYDLPNLNIIIEDKGKDKSIWKFNIN